jgi:hypothetical protein
MEQFYVFANTEDSLNIFNDNAGDDFESIFQTLTSWTERGNVHFWGGYVRPQVDHTDAKDLRVL